MAHQLAGMGAALTKAQAVYNVVQRRSREDQQVFTRDATHLSGFIKVTRNCPSTHTRHGGPSASHATEGPTGSVSCGSRRAGPEVGAFDDSTAHLGLKHRSPFKRAWRLHDGIAGKRNLYLAITGFHSLLRRDDAWAGRHPLWGIGVPSLIIVTSIPAACNERIAASRLLPGAFLYIHFHRAQAMLFGGLRRRLSSHRAANGCTLARTAEPHSTRTGPRNRVARPYR